METIITTTLSTLTGFMIGYLIRLITSYKNRDNIQHEALKNILKSNL